MGKTLTMLCTVKEFQWTNPHSWVVVVAPNDAGTLQEYRFEGAPPAILLRSGWTEDTLQVGDHISLEYHPHKDGEPGGSYTAVTLPNGKRLSGNGAFFGPFNPEKPPDPPPSPPTTSHPIEID